MKNLLMKSGKYSSFVEIEPKYFILKEDHETNYDMITFYREHNDCAVFIGFHDRYVFKDNIPDIEKFFEKFLKGIYKSTIEYNNLDREYRYYVYQSSFEFLNKLINISKDEFNKFKKSYEIEIEKEKIEREKRYNEYLLREKQKEEERIKSIIQKIKNNENVSGREILDLMNETSYNCAIKTKGLINRCKYINDKEAELKGKTPQKSSINSLFLNYSKFKNFLIENF